MAASHLDQAVIKRTQSTLGKYIKKPPLTEKLLKKPPFRFLHDVFNVIIRDTGCFVGLYTAEELDIDSIKDRDDKMRFLQKMIDVIKIVTNMPLAVRTSKIVAGHEPENTNELLQLIGEVIEQKLEWKQAVQQVLGGKTEDGGTTKAKVSNKPKESKTTESEKLKERTKDIEMQKKKLSSNDRRNSIKGVSPPTKDSKFKKPPITKEKERDAGRVTKSKSSKEIKANEKDKLNEKDIKIDKRIEENLLADKNGSSIKNNAKIENVTNNNIAHIDENQNKVEIKSPAHKTEIDNPKLSNQVTEPVLTNVSNIEQDNIKQLENTEEFSVAPTDQSAKQSDTLVEVGSRKSSAQRKESSAKARHTSATNVVREELLLSQPSSSNKGSSNVEPRPTQAVASKPPAEASAPSLPRSEMKRESTFTRDERSGRNVNSNASRPRTSLRPPSARPASARPGAPRRRDKNVEIILQPNDPVKMSGINVKLESFGDLDEDGDNLVIIEDASADNILATADSTSNANANDNMEQQGHLVQQILETQKELVLQNADIAAKTEKESNIINKANVRQSSARQMNNLRDIIQSLTKAVNPFGKLMDFIPEDIDAMQLELTMWRDTYTQAAAELKRERSLTESATEPMKLQLVQIEANIKEYVEMIDASRTKILQNSEKIIEMLTKS